MNIRTPIRTHGFDWQKKYKHLWDLHLNGLSQALPESLEKIEFLDTALSDVPIVWVKAADILLVLQHLKNHAAYDFLADITATDETPREPRFDIVYQLFSWQHFARLRLKTKVAEKISSVSSVFPSANWAEREVFDMFGVAFEGHPDLRRILMHEEWQGHPLRKDYPLRGYQIYTETTPPHKELLEDT